jgi:hypothetical protein
MWGDTTIKTYASRRLYNERVLRIFKQVTLSVQVHNRPVPGRGLRGANRRSNCTRTQPRVYGRGAGSHAWAGVHALSMALSCCADLMTGTRNNTRRATTSLSRIF